MEKAMEGSSMRKFLPLLIGVGLIGAGTSALVLAYVPGLKPEKVRVAEKTKRGAYVRDGLIVGGDQAITDVIILDLRQSKKYGFERLVLDLEGNLDGEPATIDRPPYFQTEVSPDMRRVVFTVWGNPRLAIDSAKIVRRFRKSKLVRKVHLMPVLEPDRWRFVLEMKKKAAVEVFELSNPIRIVMDLKPRK
jgi:hypothetical protein